MEATKENPEQRTPGSQKRTAETTDARIFPHPTVGVNGNGHGRTKRNGDSTPLVDATPADGTLYDNIPADLKALPQWVVWKLVPQPDGKKPKKVPKNPANGRNAAVDEPQTWGTFAEAVAAVTRYKLDGIGFVFTEDDPYIGIDVDKCRNAETGELTPFAHDTMQRVVSYTEASPSGTGLHIIAKGKLPAGGGNNGTVEMYDTGRFFTCTGEHIGGTPTEIEAQQEAVYALYAEQFPEKLKPRTKSTTKLNGNANRNQLSDDEVIALATGANNGAKVKALLAGELAGYPSASDAEMALCNQLTFYCGPDSAEQIDRIVRHHLKADRLKKWDEKHYSNGDTYGQRTVQKALEGRTEFYTRPRTKAGTHDEEADIAARAAAEMDGTTGEFRLTDLGNGERFVKENGRDFLFCNPWKKWLVWDGIRWKIDDAQTVRKRGRATVRGMYTAAGTLVDRMKDASDPTVKAQLFKQQTLLLRHAVQSENAKRVGAMIDLAQMDLPVMPDDFDKDLWALNVKNGTLDLRTGEIRAHTRTDLLTKCVPLVYDPAATCPLWKQFLSEIMGGNDDLVDFLWKAIGYSLTGDVREDCLFLLYGLGANGKTTLLNVLRALVADYGKQAAFSTFLHHERETVRNDLADLHGARLVVASETDEGKKLSMSVVKALTGKDMIKARFLFAEYFEYAPQMKLWLGANHKPVITGTDHGIWRRIRLVPFTQKFKDETDDKKLGGRLKAELPGILAWAVRGCLDWQAEGLPMPKAVATATAGYRAESDVMGSFLAECCRVQDGLQTSAGNLLEAFKSYSGDKNVTHQKMKAALEEKGHLRQRSSLTGLMMWQGIGILESGEKDDS